ncbi:EamA family transporter RarD [Marinospirillum perlucidum]|uniref:EamA family transporter RarD n=1 Tax=Marinospirillum perlucidum TaxID=1982602 RepID=UPI000DF36494|nr:EamA family transporter RarD [Marinospirillum perlucidum]
MQGLVLALAAYMIWGCFPLFFHQLNTIPPSEILAHRVIWALTFTLASLLLLRQGRAFLQLLKQPKALGWLAVSGLLISSNWLVFIWAVGQGRVIEASLGYFISPLVSLLMGWLLLKEKQHPLQLTAGFLATLAIAWEVFSLGKLPWIPVVLAMTVGCYGLVRKRQPVDSLQGLTVETLWLLPLALGWLLWMQVADYPVAFGRSTKETWLLVASGLMTASPLLLFAAATRRLNLSIVGFIMYINPMMQFITAVWILGESYSPQRLVTFALIWIAMILFMGGVWRQYRQSATTAHQ